MMKKRFQCLIFYAAITSFSFCAAQNVKFGKISMEELQMTTYEKDSTASAIVLYEEMDVRYEYDSESTFKVVNSYFVRIKIVTNEGLSQADQSVVKYLGRTNAMSERLSGLSGNTYNLVNGKIEQTKLSKEHIFEEKTSESVSRTKFAFQSVKPGSVIEYKYELSSPIYWNLNDYYFQRSIPVKYSMYTLKIPEYFSFSKEIRGMEPILFDQGKEAQTMRIGGYDELNFVANVYEFTAKYLPGLKDEDYVWNVRDFMSKVTFEMQSFIIPGIIHKNYSNTWGQVDEFLLDNQSFGKQFNHKFFKDELTALFTQEMTNLEKVRAIYYMVKSRVKWNDENTFGANNPRDALKKGLGTSGEINAILISALREAGFEAYPIAMRLRPSGRIPLSHPTIDYFNYFIVAVNVDGKPVYLDAAEKYGDLNVLSPSCLSDFTRSIQTNGRSSWVDLTNISKSSGIRGIFTQFNENGELSGKVSETSSNQLGFAIRNRYSRSKDEQDFFDNIASSQNIIMSSPSIENIDQTGERVKLEYEFTKNDVVLGDDYIYFNPLIFPLYDENPFKAEDRKLPVEFSYPHDRRINVVFHIPEGYQVEELPKSTRVTMNENNDLSYQYIISENKEMRSISILLQFSLNRIIYPQKEYEALRELFLHLATSNNERVVLKKITQ